MLISIVYECLYMFLRAHTQTEKGIYELIFFRSEITLLEIFGLRGLILLFSLLTVCVDQYCVWMYIYVCASTQTNRKGYFMG